MASLGRLIGKMLLVTLTVGTAIVAGQAFYARFNPGPESAVSYPAGSRVATRHIGPVARASTPDRRVPPERAQQPRSTRTPWPHPKNLLARLPWPAGDREELSEELGLALVRLEAGGKHDVPPSGDR
jgi:hypothetical protein